MGLKDVIIPKNKDPKSYFVTERRAEILRLIVEAGHPDLVSRAMLINRYGITGGMISKDFKAIGREIIKELGTDAQFVTSVIFKKALKKLMTGTNKDIFNAAKLAKDWNDWLFDSGVQKRAPQQVEVKDNVLERIYQEHMKKRKEASAPVETQK